MSHNSSKKGILLDAINHIANTRLKAANARFQPRDLTSESTYEVAIQFLENVQEFLSSNVGIAKLIKTRREVSWRIEDLSAALRFRFSAENIRGVSIQAVPYLIISSGALRKWRQENPIQDSVASALRYRGVGGDFIEALLGNFLRPREFIVLELVDPCSRRHLAEQIAVIGTTIFDDLFKRASDKEAFFKYASDSETVIECPSDAACEYISAKWGKAAVLAFGKTILQETHTGISQFSNAVEEARAGKVRKPLTRLAGLASYASAHGLSFPND